MKTNKAKNELKHYTFRYSIVHDGYDVDMPTLTEERVWSKVEAKTYEEAVKKLKQKVEFYHSDDSGMSHHVCDIEPFKIISKNRTRIPTLKGYAVIK
jgi:hypothetical protein